MKRVRNGFIKNLRYVCLIGVIAFGLITIVGSNGGDGKGGGGTTPGLYDEAIYGIDVYGD
jgi:hypothetical protein